MEYKCDTCEQCRKYDEDLYSVGYRDHCSVGHWSINLTKNPEIDPWIGCPDYKKRG